MNIDTHLIERYLQDEPVYADADAWIFRNTDPIDPRRHDVVHELCRQVCGLRWPCFNPALHARLFPHLDAVLEEMTIILIAASSDVPTYLCEHDGQQHLVIDLIQVANLTRIVPAMMHIICNFISLTRSDASRATFPDHQFPMRSSLISVASGMAWPTGWPGAAMHRIISSRTAC